MICEICNNSFELQTSGSGGSNRTACYSCVPTGLSRSERNSLRFSLLRIKASKEKLELGCSNCGYNKCSAALEWHHPVDDKDINPSNTIPKGWKAYLEETSKCTLLCANCHREAHFLK